MQVVVFEEIKSVMIGTVALRALPFYIAYICMYIVDLRTTIVGDGLGGNIYE